MIIDVSPHTEAQLKAKAQAEGVSVGAYVERLVFEEDSRHIRLVAFRQAVDERLKALNHGAGMDGEEVMAHLIAEIDAPGQVPSVVRQKSCNTLPEDFAGQENQNGLGYS